MAVAEARQARLEGRLDEAAAAYERALRAAPALGGLRIEWADVLDEMGKSHEAVKLLEATDPADRSPRLHLARLLAADGRTAEALAVLERLQASLPNDPDVAARIGELRRAQMAEVPEQVRAIAQAAWASRADLAALLVATVPTLRWATAGAPPVVTDIDGQWAREYIVKALALELMETYPNHTFQPGATVRRADLGFALGRALAHLRPQASAATLMSDVTPGNRLYPEISRAVAAGILPLTPQGAFEPWRPVTGAEAARAVASLVSLAE